MNAAQGSFGIVLQVLRSTHVCGTPRRSPNAATGRAWRRSRGSGLVDVKVSTCPRGQGRTGDFRNGPAAGDRFYSCMQNLTARIQDMQRRLHSHPRAVYPIIAPAVCRRNSPAVFAAQSPDVVLMQRTGAGALLRYPAGDRSASGTQGRPRSGDATACDVRHATRARDEAPKCRSAR